MKQTISLVISIIALVVAGAALKVSLDTDKQTHAIKIMAASSPRAVEKVKGAWPGLGQEKTIAIGEALTGGEGSKVIIYCASPDCRAMSDDLDDALQIAGWPSEFERRAALGPSGAGLFIGPDGSQTRKLRDAIAKTLPGTPIEIVPIAVEGGGIGVMFGKKP